MMALCKITILIVLTGLFFQTVHQAYASCTQGIKCTDLKQVPTPLKQFESGIPITDILCHSDFTLILNSNNGHPACVTLQTAQRLIDQGWGTLVRVVPASDAVQISSLPIDCQMSDMIKTNGIAMLYMPVNSVGKICAQYSNFNDISVPATIEIHAAKDLSSNATGISIVPSDIMIPPGISTKVYTIKTENQTGFYSVGFFCMGTPLSVGNNPKIITSDDFPWLGKTFYCGSEMFKFQIRGLDGIEVKYLSNP